MSAVHPPLVRTRLSAMMFLEFFVWGGWMFPISGYAATLQFTGSQAGWLMSTTALGAIIAPLFVGYVADRLFATERILSVMHLLGALCMFAAYYQTSFYAMMTCMMLNGLFFMPTLALANSLAFRHIPDPSKFPRITLLGTIGWIVATLIVAVTLEGEESPKFFLLSGIGGIILSLYCLTLPHTPPKGGRAGDVLGLGALKLLKDPSFLVFTLCAFLVTIPIALFFVAAVPMFKERGYPAPLALTTLNQFSEIFFMFTMPLFVVWLGLKPVLALGMLAWAVRYVCFAIPSFPLTIVGLLLHGFCYSFVFVGAYMYVDQRAPADVKASAQSLIAFLMLGVGWFLGSTGGGYLKDQFPPAMRTMPAVEVAADQTGESALKSGKKRNDAPLPPWNDPAAAQSAWRYLDLSGTINEMRTGKKPEVKPDLTRELNADKDGAISLAEVKKIPDTGLRFGNLVYSRDDMVKVFQQVASIRGVEGDNPRLTRADWLGVQSHRWKRIWLLPAAAVAAVLALFLLGFRDKAEQPA